MSQRTLNQKKSQTSLKSISTKSDRVTLDNKRKDNSCDSETNLPFHRPRCPWGRRQSYIQRVRKTFLDNSSNCLNGANHSSVSKKPWLSGSSSSKDETWKRPWGGNKITTVNCFCTRLEQAKVAPPTRKTYQPDWIENRRNRIVNKFDGFSKNLLKITGKLSQVTIDMITAKIRENLEKNSDSLENVYNSSFKIAKTNPYSKLNESNRILSSKFISDSSCIQVALMPSEFNMLGYKNHLCEKSKPSINVHKKNTRKLRSAEPSSIKRRLTIGKEKSVFGEKLTSISDINLDKEESTEIKTDPLKSVSSREKGIVIRVKVGHVSDKHNRNTTSNANQANDKLSDQNEKEKSTPVVHKVVNFCDRPVSVDDCSLYSADNDFSAVTSPIRPSSVGGKLTHFREKSVLFDEDIQQWDKKSIVLNDSELNSDDKTEETVDESASYNSLPGSIDKQDSSLTVESVKSNMNFAQLQDSAESEKKTFVNQNKNSKQSSSQKKIVNDLLNLKKLMEPSTQSTGSGYSVQLVKLRNHDIKDKKPCSRK